jgi:hypothetical protein
LKNLNIDRDNIKMNFGEIRQDVKLIDLARGRKMWQTLVKKVMKGGLHKTREISGLAEDQLIST